MTDKDYNSGWFGFLVLLVPIVIVFLITCLYYAVRNHII